MVRGIDAQSLPMLTALCNDRSLLNSCTCRPPQNDVAFVDEPLLPLTKHSTVRRLSLSQGPYGVDQFNQPGTVVRPNSWSSELQANQVFGLHVAYDIDIDGVADSPRYLYANGMDSHGARGRGLVHRHSDGAAFQHAAAVIGRQKNGGNVVKSPPSYVAA